MNTIFFYQREYDIAITWPILIFILVLFPILIFISIKEYSLKQSVDEKNVLSLDDSLILRGIAITCVMFTHYSQGLVDQSHLTIFTSVGYISVAIFFLLSGYASYTLFEQKGEKIWDGYFSKRLLRLLVPFWIVNMIHSIFYLPTVTQFFWATLTFKRIIGDVTEWPTVWFVVTIIYFTVLFWLSFRFTRSQKLGLIIFLIGTLGLMIIQILLNYQSYWYNSSLAFLTGIVYAMYKDSVRKILMHYKVAILSVIGIVFGSIVFISTQGFNPGWLQIICSELCIVLILTLEQCVIIQSRVLKMIGTVSWEIFLIHQLVYSVYYSVFKDFYGLSGILCILISIIAGVFVGAFDKRIVFFINEAVRVIKNGIAKKIRA